MRYLLREQPRETALVGWTKHFPGKEGAYWYRETIRYTAIILHVQQGANGRLQHWQPGVGWRDGVPEGQWFGPMQEPGGVCREDLDAINNPDVLFDALLKVAGTDPKATWSALDRLTKILLAAKPPYEPTDVLAFAEKLPELLPRHKGPVTLELIEKHIAKVRAKAKVEEPANGRRETF